MIEYNMKVKADDFIVSEINDLVFDSGHYYYYILEKKGLRTLDCILYISKSHHIDFNAITYSGLKDEDAITRQYICIKGTYINNLYIKSPRGDFFSINYVGQSSLPLKIGKHNGNHFRIILRNIRKTLADRFLNQHSISFNAINYYGIQRFGLPNKPKISFKIGENLLKNNYNKAFKYLYFSGNISPAIYHKYKMYGKNYFDTINCREKTFFLASYDSYIWNNKINSYIITNKIPFLLRHIGKISFYYNLEELSSNFVFDNQNIIWHRYNKYNSITTHYSSRQPLKNITINISNVLCDELYPTRFKVCMDFNLDPGVYATTIVDQLMAKMSLDI